MRFTKFSIITAALALAPFVSQAAPVSVTTDPTLSVAGLTFNDFSCSITGQGMSSPGGCGKIKVGTIETPGTGLRFNSGFSATGVFFNSFTDAMIDYHVSAGPNLGINKIGLDFNGTFLGFAVASVTESIYSGSELVGTGTVSCGITGCDRTDDILLNGTYADLHIVKDIQLNAYLGTSQISYIDQTFDPVPTPEPSSLALIGSGFLGVAGLLRRRAKRARKAVNL
jgi:hypothetical protein